MNKWSNELFQKKIVPPVEDFLKLTPWISSQIYRIFFLHWPPWKTNVFSSSFGVPPGIQTTFEVFSSTLEFPINILNGGVTVFFWKSPIYRKIIMVKPNEHYDQGALVFRQDRSQRIITNYFAFHIFMNAYPGKPLKFQWTVINEGPDILAKHIQRSLTGRGWEENWTRNISILLTTWPRIHLTNSA